jgi:phage FluMu protein Com
MVQYIRGSYMTTTRCETCCGKKTILGLGMINKQCPDCKGVGHIKIEPQSHDNKDKKRS